MVYISLQFCSSTLYSPLALVFVYQLVKWANPISFVSNVFEVSILLCKLWNLLIN
jgi:hypothetical protein